MENNAEQLDEILQKLENIHYPSGPVYSKTRKLRAIFCMQKNELEAIYNLVESHRPNLRFTATQRYEKALESLNNVPLNKNNFSFQCSTISTKDKIKNMLEQLSELPREWTIVQLTSKFNIKESLEVDSEKFYTNPLHISVFNCGKNEMSPFTITVDAPTDKISGNAIEIRQEMHSIIVENKQSFSAFKVKHGKFSSQIEKQRYCASRMVLNNRLKDLVKQIQDKWLAEWRCLLLGKFIDDNIEKIIASQIEDLFKDNMCSENKIEKNKCLLKCIFRGSDYLKIMELRKTIKYLFPEDQHKSLRISIAKMIQNTAKEYKFSQQTRHPLLLITDEKLDFLPWEMIDVLQDHPVSRLPSLHFTYALFKEHEDTIVNGYKICSQKGNYIVNPDLDLKQMEIRLCNFFNYWLPNWSGIVGVTPCESDFKSMLTNNDVFVYCGHGNGTQFLAGEKIQKLKVNAVVLLFGCSSVKVQSLGPQVEMYSNYQTYLIACSPCVVGMLWEVPDLGTDTITAEFLSQWLPSNAPKHWKLIDTTKWQTEGSLDFSKKSLILSEQDKHEPELLRALCKAKKLAKQYLLEAACVARGLPVKIQ